MEIDLIMAKNTQNISTEKQTERAAPDFNGAAIIDENGVEVAITEEMVQSACDQLDVSIETD
jgi:hypothetical protein